MTTPTFYEALGQFQDISPTLAYIYRQLSDHGEDVNRYLRDLHHVVEKNAADFGEGSYLFWGESTARKSADFERVLAKYEIIKRIFAVACEEHGIEYDLMVALILQAQGVKQ